MSSTLQPLPATPGLAERCYETLLEAILTGALDAHRVHTQDSLALRLGVSRQPVMHALQRLRHEEMLVLEDNGRGLRITPINATFIQNLYQLREALDAAAASAAAVTPRPELRDPGTSLIRAGRLSLAGRQPAGLSAALEADRNFHLFIYEASHNPLLVAAVTVYLHHSRRVFASLAPPRRVTRRAEAIAMGTGSEADAAGQRIVAGSPMSVGMRRAWSGHKALLAAIVKGDAKLAEKLARSHARETGRFALSLLFDAVNHP